MKYSAKPEGALLWKGPLTREEIIDRYRSGRFSRDWLVCPVGDVRNAVAIETFIEDEAAIANQIARNRAVDLQLEASADAVADPGTMTVGGNMVAASIACMVIGNFLVSLVMPAKVGKGIEPWMWYVLVPIWTLGVVGVVLYATGCVQRRVRRKDAQRQQMSVVDVESF